MRNLETLVSVRVQLKRYISQENNNIVLVMAGQLLLW